MLNVDVLTFGGFRLDEESARLWHADAPCPLRPKSFAVLLELCRNRGRLVTKERLFRTCWPDTAVSPTVLRVCMVEIRAALAAAGGAVSVEAVGRLGYRLVVPDDLPGKGTSSSFVGREREQRALQRVVARAGEGLRQAVLVHGEPGIGKTTLLRHFVEDTRRTAARVAVSQCVELTGPVEPYLPILELLGRLCGGDDAHAALAALERWAPTWLLHLPGLVDAAAAEQLRRRVPNPNRDRMLRELADFLDALAAERTLVLVIDDMHWIDGSSADALAYVAQRSTPARLLLLGSYRPADLRRRGGRLAVIVQRLLAARRAREIALDPLGSDDVASYLTRRLDGAAVEPAFSRELHSRTAGNPLYLTATIDHLLERGLLASIDGRWRCEASLAGAIPDGLRALVQQQLQDLGPLERRLLDGACVVGTSFSVAAVAAATGLPEPEVEDACAELAARNEIVTADGVADWPDGTRSDGYRFRHVLYREVLEEALAPSVRRRFHGAVAQRLLASWGSGASKIAAELAVHFATAGDAGSAVRHHEIAASAARARFAEREAAVHLRAALRQLERLPASTGRSQTELALLLELGSALTAARGVASHDVRDVHRRALVLAEDLDVPMARLQVHGALFAFDVMRADLDRARAAAEALLSTADALAAPFFSFMGHVMVGCTCFNLGVFAEARQHLESARRAWRQEFPQLAFDPDLLGRAMLGFTAVVQGDARLGEACVRDCLARAQEGSTPYNLSYAWELAAQYHATVGDRTAALAAAGSAAAIAGEHGFVVHGAVASIVRGWSEGDAARIRAGIGEYEEAGQLVATSFFRGLLAETLLAQDRVDEARAELSTALAFVERTGERRHLAELLRLEGECLRRTRSDLARPVLHRSLAIAREQEARLWELRAATSLAELLVSRDDRGGAREVLVQVEDVVGMLGAGPNADRFHLVRARL